MSISYENRGRIHQKARTRAALITAARRLLSEGQLPSVEQAAAQASISRPTAYRYFANQRALLMAANPEVTMPSLLGPDASDDPVERLDETARLLTDLVLQNEAALRAMLRLSLESRHQRENLVMRTGRRIIWVQDAIAPLESRMTPEKFRALVLRLAMVLGIESLAWLTDIAQVPRDEAAAIMRQSAHDMLTTTMTSLES
jgi:AcrR family transcriptional regulator